MRERLGDFSIREKNLWFEFMLDVGIALYYYPKAYWLMRAGEEALTGRAMANLVAGTVTVAIVIACVLSLLVHSQQKPEPKDERDLWIEARGRLLGSRVMVAGIVATMGMIVGQSLWPESYGWLFTMTPLVIAHCLLITLMFASMVDTIVRLYLYRLGD